MSQCVRLSPLALCKHKPIESGDILIARAGLRIFPRYLPPYRPISKCILNWSLSMARGCLALALSSDKLKPTCNVLPE